MAVPKLKTRQTIRHFILFMTFFLFPIIMFYFSPYLFFRAVSTGLLNGSFIVFVSQFILGLFLGRSPCGWFMPCGGAQELCSYVNPRKVKGGKLNWIKWFIWLPWLGFILFMLVQAGGIKKIDFFYGTTYGISIAESWMYILYYGIGGLLVFMAMITGKRANCHYICWMAPFMMLGRKVGEILHLPQIQLRANKGRCVACQKCNDICPMSLDVMKMVQTGQLVDYECIYCGECADVCKQKVLRIGFGSQSGRDSVHS